MKKDRTHNTSDTGIVDIRPVSQPPVHISNNVFALLCDILTPVEETPGSSIGTLHWNACKRASLVLIKQHKDKLG